MNQEAVLTQREETIQAVLAATSLGAPIPDDPMDTAVLAAGGRCLASRSYGDGRATEYEIELCGARHTVRSLAEVARLAEGARPCQLSLFGEQG